ncbi:hypothetical protein TNIN_130201 [Trichonephila inaurata madagascariensis]|uniref:TIL domain-containing protein n=1 Tax=Trichonephila inaurata madagascariensis TaxID=2747483 RepID=A0A8X6XYC7_9ARAC|nr:hypothetical protein TNIN_130201 [Trichonephila inaurata madagascariensis]
MAKFIFFHYFPFWAPTGIINADYQCPLNEHYGTLCTCEKTCYNSPEACAAVCVDGCYCNRGYIRQYPGGICIPNYQCFNNKKQ